MTRIIAITLSVLPFFGLISSCSSSPSFVDSVPVSTQDGSLSAEFFAETNSYRGLHGKKPLAAHAGLNKLARQHAQYLLQHRGEFSLYGKNVSHFGFEGRAVIAKQVYGLGSLGENVASGPCSPKALVASLDRSENHKYAMLSGWTYMGVGVVKADDGMIFAVQMFGTGVMSSYEQNRQRFGNF